ncbi:iron-containing alcohol dehydrogenase, partial [Pseudomonas sp. KK4]|uniref:iron-containing alcohol dehydrogenase n=1 Tax=Pseudomonas sp. KK4 TaxID=1855729 RepID=UPI001115A69B
MNPFQFYFPTTLKSGNGLVRQAGALLKPHVRKKLLVVTDEGLMATGVMQPFFASLTDSDIAYEVFAGVEPNPTTDVLERA